jgi:di/tricarboxylate transporter
VVLGAAVGLEAAVTESGLSKAIGDLLASIGGNSPMMNLTAVFVSTILLTNIVTNAAAAALMFPVAVSIASAPTGSETIGAQCRASVRRAFRQNPTHPTAAIRMGC